MRLSTARTRFFLGRSLFDKCLPGADEVSQHADVLAGDVTLDEHVRSQHVGEAFGVDPVGLDRRFGNHPILAGIDQRHVEMLVEPVIDRPVVAGRFNSGLPAGVLFGDVAEAVGCTRKYASTRLKKLEVDEGRLRSRTVGTVKL